MTVYSLYTSDGLAYPKGNPLFRPGEAYPEYPFGPDAVSAEPNPVYEGVRETLHLAGLDVGGYGDRGWNPLGEYISPGMRVLVKPNLVMHENLSGNGTDCLYTHPSVIAAAIDYIAVALRGSGSIVLADAPMQSCDFDTLAAKSGLRRLVEWYRHQGIAIELKDLRGLRSVVMGSVLKQEVIDGAEGKVVDLGQSSSFYGAPDGYIDGLRITNYDPRELRRHHTSIAHEYLVADELLGADVVVNLPKAKTHRKAGVTGALKNMVGVNVRKEYLPHHSNGSKARGSDEYEAPSILKKAGDSVLDARNRMLGEGRPHAGKILSLLARGLGFAGKWITGDPYSEGSWWGNDTIWRTVLDLNKIVFHVDRSGTMRGGVQRRMVVICDMVVVGQGEGPLFPEPGDWRMLAFCDDPAVHDVAMARLMGTDSSMIPTVREALLYEGPYGWRERGSSLPRCSSNSDEFDGVSVDMLNEGVRLCARPTSGWAAHFERHS